MILDDLAEVVYAPVKLFKKVVANPKYLATVIVLVLFISLATGYEFVQSSKIYTENTVPSVDQLPTYLNSTYWTNSSTVTLSNNFADPFNYSIFVAALGTDYSVFGNSSLEMDSSNTNSISASLNDIFNVPCNESTSFQNLTMVIKQVAPTFAPQNATLTLYSLNQTNTYSYSLTSDLSSISANVWNNLTIPLGPNAQGWTSSGSPTWGNITGLQLNFVYPSSTNITLRIGALYFGGQYVTPVQENSLGLLFQFVSAFGFQFILTWFLLTGIMYLFFRGFKAAVTWKPLFVSLGFALFVMVIREAIYLIAAAALPALYYPWDVSLGVRYNYFGGTYYGGVASNLTAQSRAIVSSLNAATSGFEDVLLALFVISYVWIGALCTIIIGSLKPEFSMAKRIVISLAAVGITLFLLLLLVGFI